MYFFEYQRIDQNEKYAGSQLRNIEGIVNRNEKE